MIYINIKIYKCWKHNEKKCKSWDKIIYNNIETYKCWGKVTSKNKKTKKNANVEIKLCQWPQKPTNVEIEWFVSTQKHVNFER